MSSEKIIEITDGSGRKIRQTIMPVTNLDHEEYSKRPDPRLLSGYDITKFIERRRRNSKAATPEKQMEPIISKSEYIKPTMNNYNDYSFDATTTTSRTIPDSPIQSHTSYDDDSEVEIISESLVIPQKTEDVPPPRRFRVPIIIPKSMTGTFTPSGTRSDKNEKELNPKPKLFSIEQPSKFKNSHVPFQKLQTKAKEEKSEHDGSDHFIKQTFHSESEDESGEVISDDDYFVPSPGKRSNFVVSDDDSVIYSDINSNDELLSDEMTNGRHTNLEKESGYSDDDNDDDSIYFKPSNFRKRRRAYIDPDQEEDDTDVGLTQDEQDLSSDFDEEIDTDISFSTEEHDEQDLPGDLDDEYNDTGVDCTKDKHDDQQDRSSAFEISHNTNDPLDDLKRSEIATCDSSSGIQHHFDDNPNNNGEARNNIPINTEKRPISKTTKKKKREVSWFIPRKLKEKLDSVIKIGDDHQNSDDDRYLYLFEEIDQHTNSETLPVNNSSPSPIDSAAEPLIQESDSLQPITDQDSNKSHSRTDVLSIFKDNRVSLSKQMPIMKTQVQQNSATGSSTTNITPNDDLNSETTVKGPKTVEHLHFENNKEGTEPWKRDLFLANTNAFKNYDRLKDSTDIKKKKNPVNLLSVDINHMPSLDPPNKQKTKISSKKDILPKIAAKEILNNSAPSPGITTFHVNTELITANSNKLPLNLKHTSLFVTGADQENSNHSIDFEDINETSNTVSSDELPSSSYTHTPLKGDYQVGNGQASTRRFSKVKMAERSSSVNDDDGILSAVGISK